MDSIDLKRTIPGFRARAGRFDLVEMPPIRYLMVDGAGDPNTSPAYAAALGALYPVAYAVKFAARAALGRDHVVPPLEGLWWAEDMASFTSARDKTAWSWTLMSMLPGDVPERLVEEAIAQKAVAGAPPVRWEELAEGPCIQTLHVGSYDDEAPVLDRLHTEIIPERGYRMTGRHHEIYLSDARRVAPERLRTILRQPVAPR